MAPRRTLDRMTSMMKLNFLAVLALAFCGACESGAGLDTGTETGTEGTTEECVEQTVCFDELIDAMAACGSGDGPCNSIEIQSDPCARMECLASCRLGAVQEAQSCAAALPLCEEHVSLETCMGDCYDAGLTCLGAGTCDDRFEDCSASQGACVATCHENFAEAL